MSGSESSRWIRMPAFLLMLLVLIAAGLLSATTAMRFAIQGGEVEVPSLTGVSELEAARFLGERELELDVDGHRFSQTVPEGQVLDQNPPAGVRVKRGRRVFVRLSLGPQRYAVPGLQGLSLRSSQIMLEQRGYALGNTLFAHTEDAASMVVFQNPESGAAGGSDPAVDVLVSLGSTDQYFLMPELTGLNAGDVIDLIPGSGFRLGEVAYTEAQDVEAGRVIGQHPMAGSRVSRNEIILLEVSQ